MHRNVLANVGPEEMDSLVDVFGAGSILGIVCNLQGATVFLEDSAVDLCSSGVDGAPARHANCHSQLRTPLTNGASSVTSVSPTRLSHD